LACGAQFVEAEGDVGLELVGGHVDLVSNEKTPPGVERRRRSGAIPGAANTADTRKST
jgi:hypothetical protein